MGRSDLLAEVRDTLAAGGVVLEGPAGIGKSALAARVAPRPAARVVATPTTGGMELWAVTAMLGDRPSMGDAAARLGEVLASRYRGPGCPVLVVDDADHLDVASAVVLLQLAVEGSARVLATRRGDRRAPPEIEALWREGGLGRTTVGPLPDDDAAEAVRAGLGGRVEARAVAALVDLAGGSPLVLREAVAGSVAAGVLVPEQGTWRLRGAPVATSIAAEAVEQVLGPLDDGERELVGLLALAGSLPTTMLAPDRWAVAERLETRGVVVVTASEDRGSDTLALAGGPAAAVISARMPMLTRRRLSAELAGAASCGEAARGVSPLRRAVWAVEAGCAPDPDELLAAARLAVDGGDPGLAERMARLALAAGGSTEAVLLASWCAEERGDVDAAEALLADHGPDGAAAAVAVALRRAEQRFWHHRDPSGAQQILESAQVTWPTPWQDAAAAQQGVFEGLDGRPFEALRRAHGLVGADEPAVMSAASLAVTFSLTVLDRAGEAVVVAEAALDRLSGPTPPLFIDPGVHVVGLAFALHGDGRLDEADRLTAEIYRYVLSRPGRQAQGWAALIRAHVLAARGRPAEAVDVAEEAELVWADAGLDGLARWSAAVAALARAEMGDRTGLAAALDRVDGYDPVPFRLFEPEVARARAWAVVLAGGDGRAAFTDAAEAARSSGRLAMASSAAHDLARVGAPGAAAEILGGLPEGGPVTRARRALAVAAARKDGAALVEVADRFAAMGAGGWAAEALCLAAEAAPTRAGVLLARAAGAVGAGLDTPPLARAASSGPAAVLTPREAEVARLAGLGLSNRAIAERLVVSLRTVENHLHRVYAKLGLSSRADLADAVGPP